MSRVSLPVLLIIAASVILHGYLVYYTSQLHPSSSQLTPCEPPPVKDELFYSTFENVDIEGSDLGSLSSNDYSELAMVCNMIPRCRGFNSNGWLKSDVSPYKRVKSAANLYVRQSRKDLDTNINQYKVQGTIEAYAHMKANMRVYVYSLAQNKHISKSQCDYKYGAECEFTKRLKSSALITTNPDRATLFMVPIPCGLHRFSVKDRDEGQTVAEEVAASIARDVMMKHPYFNRTLGVDHFYVCAHDMGASVLARAPSVFRKNVIAAVNTADYNDANYAPHKDISLPPHVGHHCSTCTEGSEVPAPSAPHHARVHLAMFAGLLSHGDLRPKLAKLYKGDTDILLIEGHMESTYYHKLLNESVFCLFLRGSRVWSPRLLDGLWYGCVPVIISDYYDLPLQGIIDWREIAVIIPESEIGTLKAVLKDLVRNHPALVFAKQQRGWEARHHLTWQRPAQDFDAFYSVMLQLWMRRHVTAYAEYRME